MIFTVTTMLHARTTTAQATVCAIVLLALLIAAVFTPSSQAATPPGGSIIASRAEATYIPPGETANVTVYSNTVAVTVQNVEALTLTHSQTVNLPRGASAVLPHVLTNTGNTSSTYRFVLKKLDSRFDLNDLRLVEDCNNNGVIDSADEAVVENSITLEPGKSVVILLNGQMPANGASGFATVELGVQTVSAAASAANTDVINTMQAADIKLVKSADRSGPVNTGEKVRYTLTADNAGGQAALPAATPQIKVDGTATPLILIRDAIPLGTKFAGGLTASNADVLKLYRTQSAQPYDYQTTFTDPAQVVEVAIGLSAPIAAEASASMAFDVVVSGGDDGQISNNGFIAFNDGAHDVDASSNTIVLTRVQAMPHLTMSKTAGEPRKISADTYELDYTITVKNTGTTDAAFVRVEDNLDCTFEMDHPDGPVKSWALLGAPVMHNGLLASAGAAFKGFVGKNGDLGICDRPQLAEDDAMQGFPNAEPLSLSDGRRALKPGEEEVITFSVRLTRNPAKSRPSETFVNKAFSAAFDSESVSHATLVVASAAASEALLIDPEGVVYDATNPAKLIAGARVTLTREQCSGGAASDFTLDQLQAGGDGRYTQENSHAVSMTTTDDGAYSFILKSPPVVLDCDYVLNVIAPDGYRFQSAIAPRAGTAPAGLVQPQAGPPANPMEAPYYLKFHLGPNSGSVFHNHIPLDPSASQGGQLFLSKTASKAVVEMADFVDYDITLTNQTAEALTGYRIVDTLPPGFAYEPGSSLLDDRRASDPEGGRGPVVTWSADKTLPAGGKVTLTYRVRVGVGAALGDNINQAVASSGNLRSAAALARVRVTGGAFSDEGFIIGKVFMDCNADRLQNAREIGVPGVRVFLEDGTYAISDVEGKYSFYGIKPVTHVLKLDTSTLPLGAKLIPLSNRNSGKGDSRFVDLKKGELHKADFALFNGHGAAEQNACATSPVMEEVKRRRAALEDRPDAEGEYALRARLDPQGRAISPGDTRGLPAAGIVGQTLTAGGARQLGAAEAFTGVMPRDLSVVRPLALPDAPVAALPAVKLEEQIVTLDNSLNFVDLKDQDTLPIAQANVRVKGVLGVTFRLTVNGKTISDKRVGKRSRLADKQMEAWEFIGVSFKPGRNTLKLEQLDLAGNPRGDKTITLIAPDALGKLELDLPAVAIADGNTPIRIKLRLTDDQGVPVTVRTQVTLDTDQGRWLTDDLNKTEPGTQIFVQGGAADIVLMPPNQPSDGIVRASTGTIQKEVKIAYLPELRPLVGAGILEGMLNLRRLGGGSLHTASPNDAFEKELSHFSTTSDDSKTRASGRAAFFFKGTALGKYLLTTAYDSDKDTQQRLFRDIQPDQYYPIYGDSATKGFDAQSTSRLYVRVDKDKSYLLYGDYTTAGNSDVRQLTQYSRSLTGVKGHYEDALFNVTGFYSRNGSTQVVEEFPANGTSGPYQLANGGNIVENSEKVEVLVRDRNQPSLVLAASPQTRFVDYNLEPLSKRLLFRGPVPSVDANLNRQYIRVTYETSANGVGGAGGGPTFGVGGVDAQMKITDHVQLGVIGIKDEDPANPSTLLGATAIAKLGERTIINGELARSDTGLKGRGDAERIEIRHEQGDLKARAQFTKTDKNFSNPSAYSTAGRTELPAVVEYRIDADTKLKGEALYSKDDVNGGVRKGVIANLIRNLGDGLEAQFGMRTSQDTGALGGSSCVSQLTYTTANCAPTALSKPDRGHRNDLLTVRGKLTADVPWVSGLQSYLEAEQDVRDLQKHLFAIGANYQLSEKTRLFGRYELASTLGSQFNLNSFAPNNTGVIGIESAYMKGGNLYNEYRLRDGQSGREAQSALGVRNTWTVFDGLRVGGGFETTRTFNGLPGNNSNALVGTVEYFADPRYRASASLELRKADAGNSLLNTLALSYKLSQAWSMLGRNILSYTDNKSAGKTVQTRQQIGFAYREVEQNVWNLLGRYEHKYESISGASLDTNTRAHIVSAHANYQANADLIFSARYAGKLTSSGRTTAGGLLHDARYWAQLLYGRATWDFVKDWDASLQTGVYLGKGGAVQTALGAEIGYQVVDNLWLSAGYNVKGVSDPDLGGNDYLEPGVYVRARFKFDENTLSW